MPALASLPADLNEPTLPGKLIDWQRPGKRPRLEVFSMRVGENEHALLAELADRYQCSISYMARRLVVGAALELAQELRGGET